MSTLPNYLYLASIVIFLCSTFPGIWRYKTQFLIRMKAWCKSPGIFTKQKMKESLTENFIYCAVIHACVFYQWKFFKKHVLYNTYYIYTYIYIYLYIYIYIYILYILIFYICVNGYEIGPKMVMWTPLCTTGFFKIFYKCLLQCMLIKFYLVMWSYNSLWGRGWLSRYDDLRSCE